MNDGNVSTNYIMSADFVLMRITSVHIFFVVGEGFTFQIILLSENDCTVIIMISFWHFLFILLCMQF